MQTVRDVMTPHPITLHDDAPLQEAASAMRDADIGAVLVTSADETMLRGIVTDRDLVVRGLAEGCDPASTRVGDICSGELRTVSPDASLDDAATVMREAAVRRIPVVDGNRPVGIVSIGDLAIEREADPTVGGTLADISAAPPNG